MNAFFRIFNQVDRATGKIAKVVLGEAFRTVKVVGKEAGKGLRRILVKRHRRKNGKVVRAHRRTVRKGAARKRPKQRGVPQALQPTLIERLYAKELKQTRDEAWLRTELHYPHDDLVQAYIEDLTNNPEHQAWLKLHGGLCKISWDAGRAGDEDTMYLAMLLMQH